MAEKDYVLDHKLKKIKSEDLVWHAHEYDISLESNHIYLFGSEVYSAGTLGDDVPSEPGIEYIISNRFIRNLNLCMRVNPEKPILIHMKTCGGDWSEGMAIYDAIKSCPSPITILNYSHARSMSSLIFQSANKRVMMPTSYFLFHDGTLGIEGTVKMVESFIDFNKITTKIMLNIYYNSMKRNGEFKGKSKKDIYRWLKTQMNRKEDVYLTAEQSIKYGFADYIFDGNWPKLLEYTNEQLER